MKIQSGSDINMNAVRMIPYAMLVKALVSCFMLISIGAAYLSSAGAANHGNDMFVSVGLLSILAVLGYAFAIYCLCGLVDLSGKFRTTLILLVVTVILCSMETLIRAGRIYQAAYGHQQAAMAMDFADNTVYIIEMIIHAIALFVFMKGLSEILNETKVNGKLAKRVHILGSVYVASAAVLYMAVSVAYVKGEGNGTCLLLASLLIWTVLEIVIFFVQRKAAIRIWQDRCDRSRVLPGALKKERG